MVAVKENYRRFIYIAEILYKFLHGLVRFVHKRKILFRFRVFSGIVGQHYLLIEIVELCTVTAVVLHGYVEDKERFVLIFLLIKFYEFFVIAFVRDIVAQIFGIFILEKFVVMLFVKPHRGIDIGSVPTGRKIRVQRHRFVPESVERFDQSRNVS